MRRQWKIWFGPIRSCLSYHETQAEPSSISLCFRPMKEQCNWWRRKLQEVVWWVLIMLISGHVTFCYNLRKVFVISKVCLLFMLHWMCCIIVVGDPVGAAGYVDNCIHVHANCVIKQKQLLPCVYMLTYYYETSCIIYISATPNEHHHHTSQWLSFIDLHWSMISLRVY